MGLNSSLSSPYLRAGLFLKRGGGGGGERQGRL